VTITDTDRTIASAGLPKHPEPYAIAKALRDAATRLEESGLDAIDMVSILAARGYSASTLGDGGSRGSDSTSSTERHATQDGGSRWFNADREYAQLLRTVWLDAQAVISTIDEILRHAQDIDPTPAGTGSCMACDRFCRPDKDKPGNRLVSGLCPTDYRAWARAGRPLRIQWIAERRRSFTDEQGTLHTPEPDHDLDLSRERPEGC
jgi:hypothetical protein